MSRFTLLIFMLLACLSAPAQMHVDKPGDPGQQPAAAWSDTVKINAWLRKANGCYNRMTAGNRKHDSAFYFIAASKKRSNELHYIKGLQHALGLEAKVFHKRRGFLLATGSDTVMAYAIERFEKDAISTIDQYHDKTAKANVLMALADAYDWRVEQFDQRIKLYKAAAALYAERKHIKHEGIALMQSGITMVYKGAIDEAETNLIKAIKILTDQGYTRLHLAYGALCYVYVSKGKFNEGTEYGLKAIRLGEKLQDNTEEMAEVYKNVGYCYEIMNEQPTARFYFRKALEIGKRTRSMHLVYSSSVQIARTLIITNPDSSILLLRSLVRDYPIKPDDANYTDVHIQLVNAYLKKKNHQEARRYAEELLTFANEKEKEPLYKSYVLCTVADYYISSRQYAKASKILPVCQKIEEEAGQIPALSTVYRRMYKVDSALGDFKSSLEHFKLYEKIKDSLQSVEQSEQLANLKLGFETEQQKKNILLLQKENRLKSEQLGRSSNERNLVITLALLLFIIFCLLYYQFQQNKVANKRIQVKNLMLEKLLQEKEWLIKEVHHRVKNNLQTVVSLLESQATKLKDEALDAIHESQHRVFAISLIHKKLYQAETIKTVEMATYIPELVGYIKEMIRGESMPVFEYDIDDIHLDVSHAVPVGLIVNEAVSNAIKYAFPGAHAAGNTIRISMKRTTNDSLQLIIADNGTGLPDHLLQGGGDGLGLRLLFGLTEDLGGALAITNVQGTSLKIDFREYQHLQHAS